MDARTAWERCGKPKGEPGIQNIRKQGMKQRKQRAAGEEPPPARAATARAKQKGPGRGIPKKGYRLKPAMAKIEHTAKVLARQQWEQNGSGVCRRASRARGTTRLKK